MQRPALTLRGITLKLLPPSGILALGLACNNQLGQPLPPQNARVAFQSQCAQNVITCTRSFPTAAIDIQSVHDQTITPTEQGFLVEQPGYRRVIAVQFIGSGSQLGLNATTLDFSWSAGATDDDPCTLEPGAEFSTQADPLVALNEGFHYIRLTVTNDNVLGALESEQCGLIGENIRAFHFVEVEVEVRRK